MPPRAPSITLTFDLNELREIESGLSGVLGGYDEITELHHRNGDETGASRIHKESLAARRAYKRVVEAIKASTYEKIAHIADRNSGSKRGLSSGKSGKSGRASRGGDVAKARAAMTAAAAELTARDRLQRDQTRNVSIAVAALGMRPQGVRPASMGEVDVYEALARHGLAEATGRGNTHRAGHLTPIASTLLSVEDQRDALAMLDDHPQH